MSTSHFLFHIEELDCAVIGSFLLPLREPQRLHLVACSSVEVRLQWFRSSPVSRLFTIREQIPDGDFLQTRPGCVRRAVTSSTLLISRDSQSFHRPTLFDKQVDRHLSGNHEVVVLRRHAHPKIKYGKKSIRFSNCKSVSSHHTQKLRTQYKTPVYALVQNDN